MTPAPRGTRRQQASFAALVGLGTILLLLNSKGGSQRQLQTSLVEAVPHVDQRWHSESDPRLTKQAHPRKQIPASSQHPSRLQTQKTKGRDQHEIRFQTEVDRLPLAEVLYLSGEMVDFLDNTVHPLFHTTDYTRLHEVWRDHLAERVLIISAAGRDTNEWEGITLR